MVTKAVNTVATDERSPDVELDERHRGDVDAFIERNRDALNESIRRSREEFARGDYCRLSFAEILDDCRERHETNG